MVKFSFKSRMCGWIIWQCARASGSRRRRRSRDSERPTSDRPTLTPVETVREAREKPKRSEPRLEPRIESKELKLAVLPLPTVPIEVEEVVVPVVAEVAIAEKVKRAVPRPKLEVPELITVEMTLEEQEVYALMGISPLVLVNREIKDARSAIISVALPGTIPKIVPSVDLMESDLVIDLITEFQPEANDILTEPDISTDSDETTHETEDEENIPEIPKSESVEIPADLDPIETKGVEETEEIEQVIAEVKIQSPAESRRKRTRIETEPK